MSGCDCDTCTDGPTPPPLRHSSLHRLMAPWMLFVGASCRHFVDLASARLDRRLSIVERLRYRFHWLVCRHCRLAGAQYDRLCELTHAYDDVRAVPISHATLKRFAAALEQAGE